jgi:hypothetical protein
MAETPDVEKFLTEQRAIEDRRKKLIDDVLQKKAAALKEFDDKKAAAAEEFDDQLEKLGYQPNGVKRRRSHHKKTAAEAAAKNPKPKA